MRSMPSEHFYVQDVLVTNFCMMLFNCKDKKEIVQYLDEFYKTLEKTPIALSETESKSN